LQARKFLHAVSRWSDKARAHAGLRKLIALAGLTKKAWDYHANGTDKPVAAGSQPPVRRKVKPAPSTASGTAGPR
jgi:hypothetical protein